MVRSLLALGLVLGVVATTTNAAWTDEEHAHGGFGTGTFILESTADGQDWSDHTSTPVTLLLDAQSLYPGAVKAAPLGIRTKAGTDQGTITFTAPAVAGDSDLAAALRYRVFSTHAASACTATAAPAAGWLVGSLTEWEPLTVPTSPTDPVTLAGAGTAHAGYPTWFCYQITLPEGASGELQGTNVTMTWTYDAESEQ